MIGDDLYLLTTRDASNGRVLRLPLGGGAPLASAATALPVGDLVISDIVAARDGLYALGQRDGVSHLLSLRADTDPRARWYCR